MNHVNILYNIFKVILKYFSNHSSYEDSKLSVLKIIRQRNIKVSKSQSIKEKPKLGFCLSLINKPLTVWWQIILKILLGII